MKLKENKGIGLSDAIIAISIFVIFSGIIISISYNIYLQSNFIKRNDTATNYIVEVFEYAKTFDLDSFSDANGSGTTDDEIQANIINYFSNKNELRVQGVLTNEQLVANLNQYKGYIMQVNINDISNIEDNNYEDNIIKKIDISVSYKLGGKIKTVTMSTLLHI